MTRLNIVAAVCATLIALAACGQKGQKEQARQLNDTEKAIIGAWTTEGSMEAIDDNLTAGYAQRLEFRDDGTFAMGVAMSISGNAPSNATTAIPVSATFGAELSGTFSLKDKKLTLSYDPKSITAHMSEDDIHIELGEFAGLVDPLSVKRQMLEKLNSMGLSRQMFEEGLREMVKANGKETFSDVTVNGGTLTITSAGETATYYRD